MIFRVEVYHPVTDERLALVDVDAESEDEALASEGVVDKVNELLQAGQELFSARVLQ